MSQTTALVSGIHAVQAAIEAAPERAIRLLVDKKRQDKRLQTVIQLARHAGVPVEMVERQQLDAQAQGQVHQGVVLVTKAAPVYSDRDIPSLLEACADIPLVLVLDGITDPHNLGACLRTAEAAGVDFVMTTRDRAAGLTATARKAASGAAERLPFVQVTNLARALKQLQELGVWITGAAMDGDSMHEADMTGPRAIVMGSEGKGIRRLTREHCDQLVSIPMSGQTESLNVSVATGVVLYEVMRQRAQERST